MVRRASTVRARRAIWPRQLESYAPSSASADTTCSAGLPPRARGREEVLMRLLVPLVGCLRAMSTALGSHVGLVRYALWLPTFARRFGVRRMLSVGLSWASFSGCRRCSRFAGSIRLPWQPAPLLRRGTGRRRVQLGTHGRGQASRPAHPQLVPRPLDDDEAARAKHRLDAGAARRPPVRRVVGELVLDERHLRPAVLEQGLAPLEREVF